MAFINFHEGSDDDGGDDDDVDDDGVDDDDDDDDDESNCFMRVSVCQETIDGRPA